MPRSVCDTTIRGSSAFECTYCGAIHCGDHRLPEEHDCSGVADAITHGPDLREQGDQRIPTPENATIGQPETEETYGPCEGCGDPLRVEDVDYCIRCRHKGIPVGEEAKSPPVEVDRSDDSDADRDTGGLLDTLRNLFF